MKTLKKALALLLVLSMSLSLMSVAAFADDEIIDEPATVEEPAAEETPSETDTTDETAGEVPTETPEEPAEETTEETTEATEEETTEATPEETEELADETEKPAEAETPEEPTEEEPAEEEPAAEEPAEDAEEEPAEEEIVEETMPVEETVEEPEAKPAEEIVEELPAPVEQPVLTEEELAAQAEAERLAAEEAARLEAERLAAEEAARLEAERLAALEAARLAALERRWPKADYETVRTAGSYTVTVNVPEGAFPMEVSLTVSAVEWSALDEETRALLYAEGLTEADALLDICFIDEDGNEREPDATIGVTIEAAETEIAEVYHVEDEETVTQVAKSGEAFEVGSFSIFVLSRSTPLTITEKATLDDGTQVYKVSDGFYQSAEKYVDSTNFYITSKAGLVYFQKLINADRTTVDGYLSARYPGYTAQQFYQTNVFTDKTVNLLADIDLDGVNWTPIA